MQALTSVKYVKDHPELREKIQERANKTKEELERQGIEVMKNDSHIVPVIIGEAKNVKQYQMNYFTKKVSMYNLLTGLR